MQPWKSRMSQAGIRLRSRDEMKQPETIEEELAIIAEAIDAGIDPFPPKKEPSRWARSALGWFMIIIMVSWVSQLLYRSL